MANNLSGDSLVIRTNNYVIEENSSYTELHHTKFNVNHRYLVFIILLIKSVNTDVRNYRM